MPEHAQKTWTPEAVRQFWQWQSTHPKHSKNYFSRNVGHALRNVLKATGSLRGRVLDFGCGPGHLLQRLSRVSGLELEGVDFSPKSIEEANKRLEKLPGFKKATAIDGLPTPLQPDSFDVITCIEVIEHLTPEQFRGTLAEIHRLLRPGGIALVTTPCDEDLSLSENYCPFCDTKYHNMQHMRSFKPDELRSALAGFDVLFCDGVDLARYQPERRPPWLDKSPRYIGRVVFRAIRDLWAMGMDPLLRRRFPRNLRFSMRLKPGDQLIAVARKPLQSANGEAAS